MPTPNLALPYIVQGQAQKEVTHNEALRLLDALVQLAVLDRDLYAPPGAPAEGERWIVAAGATGVWSGHDNQIAARQDGAWRFSSPRVGWLAYVVDEQALLAWTGGAWTNALTAFQRLLMLGVNTDADATNRLAVKADGALFSHDDVTPGTGDMRLALNKSAAARDAGFTFQDAFSTRALFGLLGDDDFTVKVSPDGSAFHTALSIDKDTGHVGLAGATADANNALIVKGTAFLFDKENDDVRFTFNKATAGDDVALTFQSGYSARALRCPRRLRQRPLARKGGGAYRPARPEPYRLPRQGRNPEAATMTHLTEMADLVWRAVAGLAGGLVYLILKQRLLPKQAVGVCVVAVVTAIFMGDVVAIKLGLSPGASGFALGLLAIKLCSGLIDGSLLDAGRKWLTNGNGSNK